MATPESGWPLACSASISSHDEARLFLRIPRPRHRHLLAARGLGAERLAEAVLVLGDQPRGRGEDVAGRAVVALEADHRRAGKVVLEPQNVVDLGSAPAVDRLVVVADAAQVFARLRQQPQPEVLGDVGVLVFVDQHVAKTVLVLAQHVLVLAPQPQAFEQQVAEIDGVEGLEALLIRRVKLAALAEGERPGFARRHVLGREAAVLPAVDDAGELARGPALLVDVFRLDDLLEQADLIVDAQDGEVGPQARQARRDGEESWCRWRGRCRATACPRRRSR